MKPSFLFTILLAACAWTCSAQKGLEDYISAEAAYESGDYETAVELANHCIEVGREPEYYMLRGNAFHKMEEFPSALADYDFAEKLDSKDPNLMLYRGICRVSMGMYDQGEMDLWRHLREDPENAKALYYLGVSEYMQFENKKSLEYLKEAIAIDPEYMEAHYLMGANYFEIKRHKLAEAEYEKCLELRPDFLRSKLNLAVIKLESMDIDGASQLIKDMISPDDDQLQAEILFYQAEVLFAQHDKDGACTYWKQAADMGDEIAERNYDNICIRENGRHRSRKASFAAF